MSEDQPNLNELRELFSQIIERNEYYEYLNIEPVEVDRGRVVGRIPFNSKLTTPRSIATNSLHGGVIATLIDISAIAAILTVQGTRTAIATTDLEVSFHQPTRETIIAEAEVNDIHDGQASASVVVREEPADADTQPLATGNVKCKVK